MNARYVEDPFEEEGQGRKPAKKLFGKTDLQRAALEATGRSTFGFRDNAQLKKFTELEAFALGADEESRVWAAWIKFRIDQAKHLNVKIINITMDKLIHNIGMKDKREAWVNDNRAKILKKPTAQELAGKVEVQAGVDKMEQRMKRRLNGS